MTVDALIREIEKRPSETIPLLLARHFSVVQAHQQSLVTHITAQLNTLQHASPPSGNPQSITVRQSAEAFAAALVWLEMLYTMRDALNEEGATPPALTIFGRTLLAAIVHEILALKRGEDISTPSVTPMLAEIERFGSELCMQMLLDSPSSGRAVNIGILTRTAFRLMPTHEKDCRAILSGTALLAAEYLDAITESGVCQRCKYEAEALRAITRSHFKDTEYHMQLRVTQEIYRRLPELHGLSFEAFNFIIQEIEERVRSDAESE